MIEAVTLKAACNAVIRKTFPIMKIYGSDSLEGLERPCFYTELVPYTLDYQTTNLVHQRIGFKISLLEEVPDEAFELDVFAKIRKAFGLKLPVGTRRLTVSNVIFDYTGENNDVFQITITIDWFDTITEVQHYDLMRDVDVQTHMEGANNG